MPIPDPKYIPQAKTKKKAKKARTAAAGQSFPSQPKRPQLKKANTSAINDKRVFAH